MMSNFKRILSPIIILLPLLAWGAEVPRIEVSPRITAVTVYPDRAMVKRTATVDLKQGRYLINVNYLPVLMQDDSFRIEGKGNAVTTITGMEVKRVFLEQIPEKRSRELEEEIKILQRSMESLEARKGGLVAQKAFIESIRLAWGDRISKELALGRPTSVELNDALAFIGNGITNTQEKAFDLEMEKVEIQARIDALTNQLEEGRGSAKKEVKSVEISVEVAKAGKLTLELSGIVLQAGWEPSYEVRLANDLKSAELMFKGQVRQQSSEDWDNVDLYLSTARPAIGGVPPVIFPWSLSFYRHQPVYPVAAMAAPARRAKEAELRGGAADEAFAPEVNAQLLTAQVTEEQTSVVFHIPQQVSIPADGTRHAAIIALEKLPATVEYMAIPKLSPYAYLKAELLNNTTFSLLPGKVNLFADGNYIGNSYLKKQASGEKFELFFGIDDQITVKREELKRHKEAGLFGNNRQSYGYRIEATNFRKESCTIVIKDQLPVAADEEIKVALEEVSPKPDEIKEDGTLIWKLRLEPGNKGQVNFGVKVEYPKNREVSGL